jgi:hypothetical protein
MDENIRNLVSYDFKQLLTEIEHYKWMDAYQGKIFISCNIWWDGSIFRAEIKNKS